MDIHGIKDIDAIDQLLDAWHGEKKKGLKVKVTATLLELPQALNSSDLQAGIPNSSAQALSNQIGSLVEAITNLNKRGKALSSTITALQRLNMPGTLLTEVLAQHRGPLIVIQWPCQNTTCINSGRSCWVNSGNLENPANHHPINILTITAWGNDIIKGKATVDEPLIRIAI